MTDPRIEKIADILLNYSTKVKKGDYVQIISDTEAEPLIKVLYKKIMEKEAFPVLKINFPWTNYQYYKHSSDFHLENFPEIQYEEIKKTDVFMRIEAGKNVKSLSNIDPNKISKRQKTTEKITKERLKKRWVVFDYPSDALAQEAEMSTEEFEDFVFNSCLFDWNEKSKDLDKAMNALENGKEVHIIADNTDIKFSIEERKFIKGDGTFNMPDGEIFTAPKEDSVNGFIEFSFPAIYSGKEVYGIKLEFKDGIIINSSASKNEDLLKAIIDTDEGSKKLGEFGIGLNPGITKPIKNILFDEKMDKTIHLAIGSAYEECLGTNQSAIHWDMIKDMSKDSKMILDGKVIYENGSFI